MSRTTLSAKGQVVIPKEVREQLGLQKGDQFEIDVAQDRLVLRCLPRKRTLLELEGAFAGPDSLTGALLEERRQDLEREEARIASFERRDILHGR